MELLSYKIYSSSGTISFEKPILVFIHGFGGNSAIWFKQIKPLRKMYDLLLIDLPSHGKSKILLSKLKNDFETVTQKILDVIDYLNIKKASFIGCSLGTMFVKEILIMRSELVEKYILIGAVGKYRNYFVPLIRSGLFLFYFLPKNICYKIITKIVIRSKESRKIFLASIKNIHKKEIVCWLQLLTKYPKVQREYLRKNCKKGLYIFGENDMVFLPTVKEEGEMRILKGCGHICNIDCDKEVNEMIIEEIEKNE